MKRKWKILTAAGIICAICSFYTWGIPRIINLPARKDLIEQKIYQKSDMRVNIGTPKLSMGVFPSVWISSDKVIVINKDNSNALLIENPKIKLKLFPLLFKKVEIADFSASKEMINLVLSPQRQFMLGDYELKFNNEDKNFSFRKARLNLGPYDIKLDDKLNSKTATLSGEYLQDVQYIKDKKIKLNTLGNFYVGEESADYFVNVDLTLPVKNLTNDKLKLDAQINNFNLAGISDYVSILSNEKIKKLEGKLSFNANTKSGKFGSQDVHTNLSTKGLMIIGADKPSSVIFEDKLDFKINFETINGGVKFKNSSIEAKDIGLFVNGTLTQSGKKVPAMDLTVEAKPTRLEQLCKIIPGMHNLLPDMDLYYLKKYFFYGDGEGKIRFVGRGDRPQVFGQAKLKDTYVIKRIPNTPHGADVDMKFKGKIMHLDVFVPTSPKGNVTLNGDIKIDGTKYSELKIKSQGDIIMEYAQPVINPLHEIFKFKLGPVPIMNIKGLGSIDIYSAGKKVDPHLWGNFQFKNAEASFNDIKHLEIKNASGIIEFNDTEIPFSINSGTINGQKADISGKCNVMGDVNVIAKTKWQKIPEILKVINSSDDMKDVQKVVKPFTHPDGIADIELNIYGNAKDAEHVEFNKDLFAKGKITFHNATTVLQDTYLPLNKINGVVNFDKKDADYDVTGFVRNSKIHVTGTANDDTMDLTASSDKASVRDIMDMFQPDNILPYKKEIGLIDVSLVGKYKGIADTDNMDYDKIIVDGKILSDMHSNNPIKVSSGDFNIRHGVLSADNVKGLFNNNPFILSFSGDDIYEKMKLKDAKFSFKNFNISSVEAMKDQLELPYEAQKFLNNLTDFQGLTDISGYIKNGKIWSDTNLKNLTFKYKPTDGVIRIRSGKANIRNNTLYLGNINSTFSSMPVFINGSISNIESNPNVNLYINAKPTQMFIDKIFNENSVYPVKLKGDINFNSNIKGTLENLYTNSTLNIKENSSIYYMGATIEGAPSGDTSYEGMATNPVTINANAIITPDKIKLNTLKYSQIISSQNKKQSVQDQILASGDVTLLKDKIIKFNNFKIKTLSPTSAKIFNILLKKPTIKQGNFTTDITLNGTSLCPHVLGILNISGIDIPVFDSTIRDVNLDLTNDYLYLNSKGTILTNDITLYAKAKNSSIPPYIVEDIQINTDSLDLNVIANRFNDFDTEKLRAKQVADTNSILSPDEIIIKNAQIFADKIIIKKALATNFKTKIQMNEDKILNIDNFSFNIANGRVEGSAKTDMTTFESNAKMSIKNADAHIIGENFFDMPGQIYGNVIGNLEMSCKGFSSVDCVKTLSGEGHFDVTDGRMPKLGSLEYLLKAANLVTGGITGVSINGIIDLITPLKTGEFENIHGDIKVENGVANDIEVYSHGKDLSMYMTGSYNLTNLVADMEIYGSLSKNFSSVLGKISNMSLNRLFNAIPGININEITPGATSNINKIPGFDKNNVLRVFKAEIYGDINGSNYVKSFRWIKH